jgi:hypothetical protein
MRKIGLRRGHFGLFLPLLGLNKGHFDALIPVLNSTWASTWAIRTIMSKKCPLSTEQASRSGM